MGEQLRARGWPPDMPQGRERDGELVPARSIRRHLPPEFFEEPVDLGASLGDGWIGLFRGFGSERAVGDSKCLVHRKGRVVYGLQHAADCRERQPTDLGQSPDETEPPDVVLVVFGLVRGHAPTGREQALPQVEGGLSIAAGSIQAYVGEPTGASRVLTIIGPTVITLWLLSMGILLLRTVREVPIPAAEMDAKGAA
jgi:hypothetical protein